MKRISILTILICVLLVSLALAENITDVLPPDSIWGIKKEDLAKELHNYKNCKIESKDALLVANQEINACNMDVFYVFSKDKGKYEGLSKIVYIMSDEGLSKEIKNDYRTTLVNSIKEKLGEPTENTKAVTTWEQEHLKVQIGTGKFTKYKGTDTYSVGVFFIGLPEQRKISDDILKYYHPLESGESGEEVKYIQQRLIELGYLHGNADGIFGNNTKSALEKFQKKNNLTPDGIASRTVQALLFAKGALSYEGIPMGGFNPRKYTTPKPISTPKPTKKPKKTETPSYGSYVGNINSEKFHRASCRSVKRMNESNKVFFGSREEAISRGYVPCKSCRP